MSFETLTVRLVALQIRFVDRSKYKRLKALNCLKMMSFRVLNRYCASSTTLAGEVAKARRICCAVKLAQRLLIK